MREPTNQQVTLVAMLLTTIMALCAMLCISADSNAQDLNVPKRFQPLEEQSNRHQAWYYNQAIKKAARKGQPISEAFMATADSLNRLEANRYESHKRAFNTTRVFCPNGTVISIYTDPFARNIEITEN